ncbi:MAG: class I SAM-dependent methyltransferase [Elusimicrobiales bacterium]|nr:class I SAM-dependent methyltransferase [Elusimicrobiales bacterium]
MASIGWFLPALHVIGFTVNLGSALFWWGLCNIAVCIFMIVYAKRGKLRHRDRMLGMISWTGDECVLDIGTGRGLLMIGAAKKLTTGKAYGIDIWNAEDLSDNSVQNALKNAEAEGVKDKVEIRNEDARKMSFADGAFDVVFSNLCLHNIYDPEGRAQACREIARVLKPGATALISDFRHTKDYARMLEQTGLRVSLSLPYLLDTFPPLRIIKAVKPKGNF